MKAVVYTRYGSPDVLDLKEVAHPVPGEDEILIQTRAAEATKADCELRSFKFAVNWFWLPLRIALGITKPKRIDASRPNKDWGLLSSVWKKGDD